MPITTETPQGLFPDVTYYPAQEAVPEALILNLATVAGTVEGDSPAVRVPYVAADPSVGFVGEGQEIPLEEPSLDEVVVTTGKIAVLTKMTREASTYNQADTLVIDSLERAVTDQGNTALLANAANPTGLTLTPGIVDAGTLGANLDVLSQAITTIEVNGGIASHITMDPASWGVIRDIKAGKDSAVPIIGAPAEQTERKLFGLPVITTSSMPAGTVLVSDQREIIAAVGEVGLSTSEHVYFGSDSIAVRVTWRIGWNVIHPNRLAKLTVTVPTPAKA